MSILDLIFPKKCLECGKPGKYLCGDCVKKVPPGGWTNREIYSVWKYEGVIRKAIIALKYKYATEVATELVGYLVASLLRNRYLMSNAYCLVPIPLHWHRKNFRGFNQAEEIGKLIAKELGWEFISDLLIRKEVTTPQVELKGPARRKNLQGVFTFNPHYSSFVVHSSFVVFDDVWTTGSTIKEAAKVLKNKGFKEIWGLTIAS